MAVAFQVLLYLSMGLVEFGQYFYIKHTFDAAVRDGARYAILSTATQSQFVSTITSMLGQSNISYNSSWLTVTDLSTSSTVSDVSQVNAGDELQFTLSTNYGSISNAVRPLYSITGAGIGSSKMITSTCIMVKE